MPSNRLGRGAYRDVGLLSSGTCLSALSSVGGLSSLGSVGGLASLGGVGGVRDMRDTRHCGGRYGLQNNRLGLGYRL